MPYFGGDAVYQFFPAKQERIGSRHLSRPSPPHSDQHSSPFWCTLDRLPPPHPPLFSEEDFGGETSTSMERSTCGKSSRICCSVLSPGASALVAAPSAAAAACAAPAVFVVAASPVISAVAAPSQAVAAASAIVVVEAV